MSIRNPAELERKMDEAIKQVAEIETPNPTNEWWPRQPRLREQFAADFEPSWFR